MFYTYIDNLRSYPGKNRNSNKFANLYKKRVTIEQTISYFKSSMGFDNLTSYDHISLFSDLLFSSISYLLLFILSNALKNKYKNFDSKKFNKIDCLIFSLFSAFVLILLTFVPLKIIFFIRIIFFCLFLFTSFFNFFVFSFLTLSTIILSLFFLYSYFFPLLTTYFAIDYE
ncbi:transposase [Caldicellulosiruptoraceae bacterium PP1]